MEEKKKTKEEKMEAPSPVPDYPDEVMCQSCGKFVGAYERCPHCQASVQKRVSLLLVRRIAVFGSIIGLIMLYIAARLHEPPLVRIGELGVAHNMALVRVVGKVDQLRIMEDRDAFTISLDDGTGKISLSGWGKYLKFKKYYGEIKGDFPRGKDEVEVTGQLSISDKYGVSMFLSNPRRLKIVRRFVAPKRTLGQFATMNKGDVAEITVTIDSIRPFNGGKTVMVYDETASMSLTVFDSEQGMIPDLDAREALSAQHSRLSITARLDEYRNNLQLRLEEPGAVGAVKIATGQSPAFVPPPPARASQSTTSPARTGTTSAQSKKRVPAPLISSNEISSQNTGSRVQVRGKVSVVEESGDGTVISIKDESGTARVWISANVKKYAPSSLFIVDTPISISGEISEYSGGKQLTVRHSDDVILLNDNSASSGGEKESDKTIEGTISISEALQSAVGTTLTVAGSIIERKDFGKTGARLTLSDSSANITLWVAENVKKFLNDSTISVGNKIRVSGVIATHSGVKQLELKHSSRLVLE